MGSLLNKNSEKSWIYFFYKTTNKVNGHYYYGVHSTTTIEDGYLGSGRLLLKAIELYGRENFTREILRYFNTMGEALQYEAQVVTEEVVSRQDCYNMSVGGYGASGGSVYLHKNGKRIRTVPGKVEMFVKEGWEVGGLPRSEEFKQKLSKALKGRTFSEETRKKLSEAARGKPSNRKGTKASEETCKKIGAVSKDTCYVHSEYGENRRIKKNLLQSYLDQGWLRGRNADFSKGASERTKGRIWMHNGKQGIRVPKESLEEYLSLGWIKGKLKKLNNNGC